MSQKEQGNIANIKLFNLGDTDNPDIKRVLDMSGNWTHYHIVSKNLYVPAVNWILKIGFPKGVGFYQYLLSTTKEEAKKLLEEAGERGTRVHQAIRNLIDGVAVNMDSMFPNDLTGRPEKLSSEEYACLLAFKAWADKYKPEFEFQEKTVATDLYAGTIDFTGTILLTAGEKVNENGKTITLKETRRVKVLLDWKTSGAIYDEYKAQVGAYADALDDKDIVYTGVIRLGTAHKNGVVGQAGYGYEMKIWNVDETNNNIRSFKAAKLLYDFQNPDAYEFDSSEIPFSIKLEVPKYVKPTINNGNSPKEQKGKKPIAKRVNAKKTNVGKSI